MSTSVIDAERLAVRFGDHEALRGITFQVEKGSFVAILGPNGSGKSTLLKALLGIVRLSEGTVRLFGKEPRAVSPEWIGYVPQIKTLDRSFPALAVDLVVTGLRRQWPGWIRAGERERAQAALARVGASHLAERPLGSLSGGELQRVYLARSLVRQPRLVLFDEPATGIDVVGTADLYDLLDTVQQERHATMLMVTHDLHVAYHHATHVLLLNQRQVAFGPPGTALNEAALRETFGHVGHAHAMLMGGRRNA